MIKYGTQLTCDRCEFSEINFNGQYDDWGEIRYKNHRLDICPTCMQMLESANDDYFFEDGRYGLEEHRIGVLIDFPQTPI